MFFSRSSSFVSLAAVLSFGAPASASTFTVDGGGGGDFTTIAAAVAAAADGDVIVVQAGSYAGFAVTGKSLVIRGAGANLVTVNSHVQVSGLSSTQSLEFAGMRFLRDGGTGAETVRGQDIAGVIAVRDCEITGANGTHTFQGSPGGNGVVLLNCARIIVQNSILRGGDGADGDPWIGWGGTGLYAGGGDVLVLHSAFFGGNGGEDFDGDENGGSGGPGATFNASTARVAHASFTGGNGGFGGFGGIFQECMTAGAGGDGVSLNGSNYSGTDVTYTPGVRGQFICGDQPPPTGQQVGGGSPIPLVFVPFCFGFEAACPCGNAGFGAAGCEISFATGGGRLTPTGTPSVGADSLSLSASGLPPGGSAILFQGSSSIGATGYGAVFGDGLRCAGGTVQRLLTHAVSAGASVFGMSAGDAPLSTIGMIPPGGAVLRYQVWFRNAAAFCTGATFNLTHGLEVHWSS